MKRQLGSPDLMRINVQAAEPWQNSCCRAPPAPGRVGSTSRGCGRYSRAKHREEQAPADPGTPKHCAPRASPFPASSPAASRWVPKSAHTSDRAQRCTQGQHLGLQLKHQVGGRRLPGAKRALARGKSRGTGGTERCWAPGSPSWDTSGSQVTWAAWDREAGGALEADTQSSL